MERDDYYLRVSGAGDGRILYSVFQQQKWGQCWERERFGGNNLWKLGSISYFYFLLLLSPSPFLVALTWNRFCRWATGKFYAMHRYYFKLLIFRHVYERLTFIFFLLFHLMDLVGTTRKSYTYYIRILFWIIDILKRKRHSGSNRSSRTK